MKRSSRSRWLLGACVVALLALWGLALGLYLVSNGDMGSDDDFARQTLILGFLFDSFLIGWFAVLGAVLASFFNVVALRTASRDSILGGSRCPRCLVPIAWYDNIPVLGWLQLQGRCRCCRLPISPFYPISEAIGGGLLLAIYLVTLATHGRYLPLAEVGIETFGIALNIDRLPAFMLALTGVHGLAAMVLYLDWLVNIQRAKLPNLVWGASVVVIVAIFWYQPKAFLVNLDGTWADRMTQDRIATILSSVTGLLMGVLLSHTIDFFRVKSSDPFATDIDEQRASEYLGPLTVVGIAVGWQGVVTTACFAYLLRSITFSTRSMVPWWLAYVIFLFSWRATASLY